jgi:hypothetical protein
MLKPQWLLMVSLVSYSALGDVSYEEKKNRVEFLEELSSKTVSMNIEAYRRELSYEKNNIPLDKRAEMEASLLAEKITIQVQKAIEAAMMDKSFEEASEEVKAAIEKDLELVAPELRDELRSISIQTIDSFNRGVSQPTTNLIGLEEAMLKAVQERSTYLNVEGEDMGLVSRLETEASPQVNPQPTEYGTKAELVESLVSDLESSRWVSTSNLSIKTDEITKIDSRVSLQVKVEFLGVAVEAGPSIAFRREYKTNASIMAEGLAPALLPDGNFDFVKRNKLGEAIKENGKFKRRFFSFVCDASLDFNSDYTGSGGFSVAGMGGGASVTKTISQSVNLTSRRIEVPEYIDGKSATIKYLSQICHNDFLKAKVTNTLTISDSLNVMMKNVVSGLRFSHPRTKCAVDTHCYNWFNNEIIALARIKNFPRCVEESREKFRACELRGLKGQNCAVFDSKGKKLSDGFFEFSCDVGLKCVKVQQEGWFRNWELYQYAKGKCMPINPQNYKSPI